MYAVLASNRLPNGLDVLTTMEHDDAVSWAVQIIYETVVLADTTLLYKVQPRTRKAALFAHERLREVFALSIASTQTTQIE